MSSGGELSADAIKLLLTRKPKRKGKKEIDTSVRDLATWFKLAPKAIEDVEGVMTKYSCENPNCLDDRPPRMTATGVEVKYHHTVEINGRRMCRRCWMGGWLLDNPDQLTI